MQTDPLTDPTRRPPQRKGRRRATLLGRRAVALGGLWVILSEGSVEMWWLGALVVVAATGASLTLPTAPACDWHWRAVPGFVCYFLWNALWGGVDVARCALDPRRRFDPVLLSYPLRLCPGPARVFLANTISLLPGTLSADLLAEEIHVHVLADSPSVVGEIAAAETRVAALFGVTLPPGASVAHRLVRRDATEP